MTGRSRRAFLGSVGTALASGVAGCLGDGGASTATAGDDVIEDTSFDGRFLVVELAPDNEVSQLNLIGPEGSAVAQTNVAAGETRAKLELMKIQPEPSYKHYTSGIHELVAVTGNQEVSNNLELLPKFLLTDMSQYREGDKNSQLGNVKFTLKNTGTAPTWVYDIVFSGAPNSSANENLSGNPGVPLLTQPDEKQALVTEPGNERTYVSGNIPFLFENEEQQTCEGRFEISSKIGFPTLNPLSVRMRVDVGGEEQSAGLTGEYTCSNLEMEILEGGTSSG